MSRPRAKSAQAPGDEFLTIEFNKDNSYRIKRRSGTPHRELERERAPPDGQATNGESKSADGQLHDEKRLQERPKTAGSVPGSGQYPKIKTKLSTDVKYYKDRSIYMDFPGRSSRSRAKSAVCKAEADQMKKSFDEQTSSVARRGRSAHKSPSASRSSSLSRNSSRVRLPYINQNWDKRSLLSLKSSLSGSECRWGPRTPRARRRAKDSNQTTKKTPLPKFDGTQPTPASAKSKSDQRNLQVKIPSVENTRNQRKYGLSNKPLSNGSRKSNDLAQLPRSKSYPNPYESSSTVHNLSLPKDNIKQLVPAKTEPEISKPPRGTILKLILSSGAKVSEGDDGSIIIEEIPKKRTDRKSHSHTKDKGIQMAIETRAQTSVEVNGLESPPPGEQSGIVSTTTEDEPEDESHKDPESEETSDTSTTEQVDVLSRVSSPDKSPSSASATPTASLSPRTQSDVSSTEDLDSDLSESFSSATSEQLLSRNRQQKQDIEKSAGRLEAVDEASEEETPNSVSSRRSIQSSSNQDTTQNNISTRLSFDEETPLEGRPVSPTRSSRDTVDQAAETDQECVNQSEGLEVTQHSEIDAKKTLPENVTVEEFRLIYRREILELNANLEKFKTSCRSELEEFERKAEQKKMQIRVEIGKLVEELQQKRKELAGSDKVDGAGEPLSPLLYDQSKRETVLLEKEARLLKTEEELLHREETLSAKQHDLQVYEKEIEDIEGYLSRRHELMKRKEEDLHDIEKEVRELRDMLTEEKSKLKAKVDAGEDVTEEKSKLAQLQWQFVRSSLVDEQAAMKTALRRCRDELSGTKDVVQQKTRELEQCQHAVTSLQEQIESKNKKIHGLEQRLLMQTQAPENLSLARSTSLLASGGLGATTSGGTTQTSTTSTAPRPLVHVPTGGKAQPPRRRRAGEGGRPKGKADTRARALEEMVREDMRRRREQVANRSGERGAGDSAVCSIQ